MDAAKYVSVDTNGSLYLDHWDLELTSDPNEARIIESTSEVEMDVLSNFVKEQGRIPALTTVEVDYLVDEIEEDEEPTVVVMVAAGSQNEIEIEDYFAL